ncbi:craniofacial development protein 2-like [Cataglyphis hispanica]|uniref:craniofacial development protein 2-like n=1 Tax=Cataglyphis hispanica TaxID=1086592 RepID=UPI00217F3F49|nr:craniofacial development protein 2-like [Cataglyphis hispanica]
MTTLVTNRNMHKDHRGRKENKKQIWRKSLLRCGCWNIMSWNGREQEILTEMEEHKIDICALSETKKKGKGDKSYPGYILKYSGPEKHRRATAGVGMLSKDKYKYSIEETSYTSEKIMRVTLDIGREKIHLISVYAPDSNKSEKEIDDFYETLQEEIDKIPEEHKILIMGDLNARIGNAVVDGVKQRFNEAHINDNGEKLVAFCAQNRLRINNTYYDHKDQHKITWANTRSQTSMIDFIISNRAVHPTQVVDVRSLSSADDDTIKALYEWRLRQKIRENGIADEDDVEDGWKKIKSHMTMAAEEALGKRRINKNADTQHKTWFTKEAKQLAKEKRKAYLNYLNNRTSEERQKYKNIRNLAKAGMRRIKEEYWATFTANMKHDLYGAQRKVWGMLRRRKQEVNEYVQSQKISKEEWMEHFRRLFREDDDRLPATPPERTTVNTQIDAELVESLAKTLKNRRAPGLDGLHELVKYGGKDLHSELAKLFQKVLINRTVPSDWKKSITIPIFKKGDKKKPENYRGVTLLSAAMKLFTRILANKISEKIPMSEEQQGHRIR